MSPLDLARLAGCGEPKGPLSAGARYLARIGYAFGEEWEQLGFPPDDRARAEIVASSLPASTGEIWEAFCDLAGWESRDAMVEDFGWHAAAGEGMTGEAQAVLSWIGERLAEALLAAEAPPSPAGEAPPSHCPEHGARLQGYSVGAPGIGSGLFCPEPSCSFRYAIGPTRILEPEETI